MHNKIILDKGWFHWIRFKIQKKLLILTLVIFTSCDMTTDTHVIISPPELISIPDFISVKDVKERKKRFFSFMRPIIEKENNRISKQRQYLLKLKEKYNNKTIDSEDDLLWLYELHKEYELYGLSIENDNFWEILLRRIDIVPMDLALAQAAHETGWGTSRFARLGNNMYGQWCFSKGCGLVPIERVSDAKHEVTRFKSVNDSVRSYIKNLNTNSAYKDFRLLRYEQRKNGEIPSGYILVQGLLLYSERREGYTNDILTMIRINQVFIES